MTSARAFSAIRSTSPGETILELRCGRSLAARVLVGPPLVLLHVWSPANDHDGFTPRRTELRDDGFTVGAGSRSDVFPGRQDVGNRLWVECPTSAGLTNPTARGKGHRGHVVDLTRLREAIDKLGQAGHARSVNLGDLAPSD